MQPFDAQTVEAVGQPARTTALAISALPGAADECQVPKVDRSFIEKTAAGGYGSAAPVRNSKMQPFTFAFLRVGICDPRMTAIAGLHFQTLFGERPFTGVDRSLARKSASDAFGSQAGTQRYRGERQLACLDLSSMG
jgi:hypothetical protein